MLPPIDGFSKRPADSNLAGMGIFTPIFQSFVRLSAPSGLDRARPDPE